MRFSPFHLPPGRHHFDCRRHYTLCGILNFRLLPVAPLAAGRFPVIYGWRLRCRAPRRPWLDRWRRRWNVLWGRIAGVNEMTSTLAR